MKIHQCFSVSQITFETSCGGFCCSSTDLVSPTPDRVLIHWSTASRNLGIISIRGSAHQSWLHQQISDSCTSELSHHGELTRLRVASAATAWRFLMHVFSLQGHSLKLCRHYCIFFSRHLLKTRLASSCYGNGCRINGSVLSVLIQPVKKRCNYSFNTL